MTSNCELPESKSFDYYLSQGALRRKPNIFKLFYKYEQIPNVYQLSAGLPNKSLFPVDQIVVNAFNSEFLSNKTSPSRILSPSHEQIASALQYGQASGTPEMAQWINEYVQKTIKCPYKEGFRTMISCGTTDAWNKILQVLTNEWHEQSPLQLREGLIVEEFTYSLAAEAARVRGLHTTSTPMDDQGILPQALDDILSKWDYSKGKRPHILYTVSIGQNPTGATAGLPRRKEIYKVCQKYDILIVEDEPYYFLQFDNKKEPCYLNIDLDGRVIRLDTFSKSFAPGARLGWITAQPRIIQHLFNIAEEATQQPSGFTQLVVYETLREWGIEGWNKWLNSLCLEYQERRDLMVNTLNPYKKINGSIVLDFKSPDAGMFVWIKVRFETHNLYNKFTETELARAFWTFNATHEQPVLITPGYFFAPSLVDADHMASYIRLSFAPSEKCNLIREAEGFGRNTFDFWKITDEKIMADLNANFPN